MEFVLKQLHVAQINFNMEINASITVQLVPSKLVLSVLEAAHLKLITAAKYAISVAQLHF